MDRGGRGGRVGGWVLVGEGQDFLPGLGWAGCLVAEEGPGFEVLCRLKPLLDLGAGESLRTELAPSTKVLSDSSWKTSRRKLTMPGRQPLPIGRPAL